MADIHDKFSTRKVTCDQTSNKRDIFVFVLRVHPCCFVLLAALLVGYFQVFLHSLILFSISLTNCSGYLCRAVLFVVAVYYMFARTLVCLHK